MKEIQNKDEHHIYMTNHLVEIQKHLLSCMKNDFFCLVAILL